MLLKTESSKQHVFLMLKRCISVASMLPLSKHFIVCITTQLAVLLLVSNAYSTCLAACEFHCNAGVTESSIGRLSTILTASSRVKCAMVTHFVWMAKMKKDVVSAGSLTYLCVCVCVCVRARVQHVTYCTMFIRITT
jgi:hypothetical protein